jgi:hypothetical protein
MSPEDINNTFKLIHTASSRGIKGPLIRVSSLNDIIKK